MAQIKKAELTTGKLKIHGGHYGVNKVILEWYEGKINVD